MIFKKSVIFINLIFKGSYSKNFTVNPIRTNWCWSAIFILISGIMYKRVWWNGNEEINFRIISKSNWRGWRILVYFTFYLTCIVGPSQKFFWINLIFCTNTYGIRRYYPVWQNFFDSGRGSRSSGVWKFLKNAYFSYNFSCVEASDP